MAQNVETKVRVPDLDDVRTRLPSIGAVHARVEEQVDRYFALDGSRRLKLRVRRPGGAELIEYERPETTGVLNNTTDPGQRLAGVALLPEHFRRHGYRTLGLGKIAHDTFPESVSWEVYEADGCFPFTGTLHHVRYEPGDWAPDSAWRWKEALREMGARFE